MTKTKKIFLISTAVLLLIGAAFLVVGIITAPNLNKESAIVEEKPNEPIPFPETLAMALSQTSSSTTEDGRSKFTLQATITPSDAYDQYVTWSVAWGADASRASEPATNYVKVTPESEGSLIATIECVKPFYGDTIIVTVTTRDGGYTANCECTYKVLPTDMRAELSEFDYYPEYDIYVLGVGEHTVDLSYVMADGSMYDISKNGIAWSFTIDSPFSDDLFCVAYDSKDKIGDSYQASASITDFDLFDIEILSHDQAVITINNLLEDAYFIDDDGRYVFISPEDMVENYSELIFTCTIRDSIYNELIYTFDFCVMPKPSIDYSQFNGKYAELYYKEEYIVPIIFEDAVGRKFNFYEESRSLHAPTFEGNSIPVIGGTYCDEVELSLIENDLFETEIFEEDGNSYIRIKPLISLSDIEIYEPNYKENVKVDLESLYQAANSQNTSPLTLTFCDASQNEIYFRFDILGDKVANITLNTNKITFVGTGTESSASSNAEVFNTHDIEWGTTYGEGDYTVRATETMTNEGADFYNIPAYEFDYDFGMFESNDASGTLPYANNSILFRLNNLSSGKTKLNFTMLFNMRNDYSYNHIPSVSSLFVKSPTTTSEMVTLAQMKEELITYIGEDFVVDIEGRMWLEVNFEITFDWDNKVCTLDIYDTNGVNVTDILESYGKDFSEYFGIIENDYIDIKYQITKGATYPIEGEEENKTAIRFAVIDLSYSVIEE